MKGTCPLTDPEIPPICIEVPPSRDVYSTEGSHETRSENKRCYKLPEEKDFTLVLTKPSEAKAELQQLVTPETPVLYAERSLTGYGQQQGGVQAILTNPSDEEVEFVYMESLPWFMRVYLHTLTTRISSSSQTSSPLTSSTKSATTSSDIIKEIYYRPALDRARGTQLELLLRIPPHATVFLTYDFEKSILRYAEYPPDANRGFDVAAAVITTTSPRAMNIRTTSMLLYLPTPDFSMPYNVIIFTSTAIALSFGGLYNIMIRRFVATDEGYTSPLKAKLQLLKDKLRRR